MSKNYTDREFIFGTNYGVLFRTSTAFKNNGHPTFFK
jgi:hypothetical protein